MNRYVILLQYQHITWSIQSVFIFFANFVFQSYFSQTHPSWIRSFSLACCIFFPHILNIERYGLMSFSSNSDITNHPSSDIISYGEDFCFTKVIPLQAELMFFYLQNLKYISVTTLCVPKGLASLPYSTFNVEGPHIQLHSLKEDVTDQSSVSKRSNDSERIKKLSFVPFFFLMNGSRRYGVYLYAMEYHSAL